MEIVTALPHADSRDRGLLVSDHHLESIWEGLESGVAILVRRDSHQTCKRTPHDINAPKPARGSNLFEAAIRSFEPVTSCFDARLQNVFGRCPARLAREYALKIPNAHSDAICKNLHRQFLSQILHDPDLKLLDGLHLGRLSGQCNAQLFLSAGSAKEKDELTRYFTQRPATSWVRRCIERLQVGLLARGELLGEIALHIQAKAVVAAGENGVKQRDRLACAREEQVNNNVVPIADGCGARSSREQRSRICLVSD